MAPGNLCGLGRVNSWLREIFAWNQCLSDNQSIQASRESLRPESIHTRLQRIFFDPEYNPIGLQMIFCDQNQSIQAPEIFSDQESIQICLPEKYLAMEWLWRR